MNYFTIIPTALQALEMSKILGVPLHPKHLDFWGNLLPAEIVELRAFLASGDIQEKIYLLNDPRLKWLLEIAFVPHGVDGAFIILSEEKASFFELYLVWNPLTKPRHLQGVQCGRFSIIILRFR